MLESLVTKLRVNLQEVFADAIATQGVLRSRLETDFILNRVVEHQVLVFVLVEVDVPHEVSEDIEVVVTALIPVVGEISLGEVDRSIEGVKPVAHLYRRFGFIGSKLQFLVERLLFKLKFAVGRVGYNLILFWRLRKNVEIVVIKLGIIEHSLEAQAAHAIVVGNGIGEPLVAGIKLV